MAADADARARNFARLSALFAEPRRDEEGRTAAERFRRRKLGLGLFLPNMSGAGGGYFPTDLDSGTEPTFGYNLRCAQLVDELGFDFVFPVGRWLGDGGRTWFNDFSLEVLTLTTALAALTGQVMVFTTWHVSYHFHPMHVAKMGATVDHISGGRWGLNIVTGWKEREVLMFGRPFAPREDRYRLGAEFVTMLKLLWAADEPVDLEGSYFSGTGCLVLPKPVQRPTPLLVNAGQSPEGIDFATSHCDVIFIQGGSGDASSDVDAVADVVRRVRSEATRKGRDLRIVLPVVLVCRDTEREALALREHILEHADWEAAETMLRSLTSGSGSWPKQTLEPIVLGIGGFKLFGTPAQAVETLVALNDVGVNGVQFEFWRYAEEIEYFGENVLPLLEQAGLREFD